MQPSADPFVQGNHRLESRMREIRPSGSEGGVGRKPYPYPLSTVVTRTGEDGGRLVSSL